MERDADRALEAFLTSVERRALHMARLATGNVDDALDIVQDAMLRLASRYRGRPAHEWPALFQRILQRRITDWYRRRAVWRRLIGWRAEADEDGADPVDTLPAAARSDPADGAGREQAMAALEQALGRLPLRQRQAFLLRCWEGLDVAETARAMGCSAGSVKTHYSRAVHALRAALGEHWP